MEVETIPLYQIAQILTIMMEMVMEIMTEMAMETEMDC